MVDDMHDNASDFDEEVEIEAIGIEVDEQPIELYKVLKIANAVSGGGEAKYAISEGYVAVNGELETRKRRKVYDSDLIEFNSEYYLVICDQPVTEVKPKEVKKPSSSKSSKVDNQANKKSNKKPKQNSSKPEKKAKSNNKGATIEAGKDGGRSRIHFD